MGGWRRHHRGELRAEVDPVRHGEGAARADRAHGPGDAGQPEHPGGATVVVVPDDVPPAVAGHDAPRLEVPLGGLRPAGRAVGEPDRTPVPDGGVDRLERGLAGAHPRLDADDAGVVRLDTGGLELQDRAGRRPGQAGLLPHPRGQAEHGQLVGSEGDLGQGVGVALHAVAQLVVEPDVVAAGLQRHAHVAELVLVPLEHAVEGLVVEALGVLRDRRAQLLLRQERPGRQQGDDQVEQPLGLLRGHARQPTR